MKKYFALIFLVAASCVYADVQTAKGNGFSRAEACDSAKALAESIVRAKFRKSIQSYGDCSCSSNAQGGATNWSCSVDAHY